MQVRHLPSSRHSHTVRECDLYLTSSHLCALKVPTNASEIKRLFFEPRPSNV